MTGVIAHLSYNSVKGKIAQNYPIGVINNRLLQPIKGNIISNFGNIGTRQAKNKKKVDKNSTALAHIVCAFVITVMLCHHGHVRYI